MRLPLTRQDDRTSVDLEQVIRMVDYFMEHGFTYFDTAYPYHQGVSEVIARQDVYKRQSRVWADERIARFAHACGVHRPYHGGISSG